MGRSSSDTKFLQELILYAVSVALSSLVLFIGLKQLDPNREVAKKALEQKKEIARRLGRPLIHTNSYEIVAPENLRRVDRRGNGRVVEDSGTTFTMIPTKLYNSISAELDRRVRRVSKRATDTEQWTGLGPCYYISSRASISGLVVPSLTLHFGGNSSVVLPARNYFYEFMDVGDEPGKGKNPKKAGCLMLMDSGEFMDAESGPSATLGNYQQQGFEVLYDLEKRRVGFAPSLWDSLNNR